MNGRLAGLSAALAALTLAALAAVVPASRTSSSSDEFAARSPYQTRRALFRELQPVALANCTLERFGESNDGGYLVCANLLGGVQSAYSYGISGYDGWGCDISRRLSVTVHQYDCFDVRQPVCEGGRTVFHAECIGATKSEQDGRPFDSLASQIVRNGDDGKHLIVKMDVEGAEWESFLSAPADVLQRIDQLIVEFHGTDREDYVRALRRLRQFFHVANLHWNNYACTESMPPFPAWAYEVLLVNKRLARVEEGAARPVLPHPLDQPNNPAVPDCH